MLISSNGNSLQSPVELSFSKSGRISITDGNLILRGFFRDDVDTFYRISHDDLVAKYLPGVYSENIHLAREHVSSYVAADNLNTYFALMIEIATSRTSVGSIFAVPESSFVAEVSYFISKPWRNQNIAYNAMKIFEQYLEVVTHFKQVSFWIKPENIPSRKLVEKLSHTALAKNCDYFYQNLKTREIVKQCK